MLTTAPKPRLRWSKISQNWYLIAYKHFGWVDFQRMDKWRKHVALFNIQNNRRI